MGTPEFARASLEALYLSGYPIVGVFTQPDKPAGRGKHLASPPCALFAKEKNLHLFQPSSIKNEEIVQAVEKLKPQFIVVVAYGKLLPQKILELAQIDCINVHASLLPLYRGAAPINCALINGEKETGVSIMRVIQKMDAGGVYAQEKIVIDQTDTTQTLTRKLSQLGASLLIKTIPLIQDQQIKPTPQDETKVSLAPPLKKEDGKILWDQKALILHNRIRGLNPWPTAYTFIDNKMLKIYDSEPLTENLKRKPGTVYLVSPKGIHVTCHDSSLLLKEVQLEGRNKMAASEFARGFRLKEGTILE